MNDLETNDPAADPFDIKGLLHAASNAHPREKDPAGVVLRRRRHTRQRTAALTASAGLAAVVAIAAVVAPSGGSDRPAPTMDLVAYSVPVATDTPTNCSDQSAFSYPSFQQAPELLHLLPQNPPETSLTQAIVEVTACGKQAWPAASFLSLDPDGHSVRQALTVWGPEAGGLPTDVGDGESGVHETTVAGRPALVRVTDWGVTQSWATKEGHWVITAAGVDAQTVATVAEHVALNDGTDGLEQQLPGLERVALPAAPREPSATYTAHYAVPGAEVEGSQDFGAPSLTIRIGSDLTPWQAYASTGPLEGLEVFDVNGESGVGASNGGATGSLTWQIAPGITATVFGTANRHSTGYRDLAPLMRTLQPAAPDDSRFSDPAVDTTAGP